MATRKLRPATKATVKKRTLNPSGSPRGSTQGDPFQHLDRKKRLGNYEGAGEHPRVGGRTSGIVGQTTKRFNTDRRKKK